MPKNKRRLKRLSFTTEETLTAQGYKLIAGIDEVGRGPLAGPVTAAAVILKDHHKLKGLTDSKKLFPEEREVLFQAIMANAFVGIGYADVEEIDSINILQATYLAMHRAVKNLPSLPDYTLVDGNAMPRDWCYDGRCEIGGDGKILSIAAASVVAKVTRDKIMRALAADFPHYGWETNAGYGARKHMDALQTHGISPHHRRSFGPVKRLG